MATAIVRTGRLTRRAHTAVPARRSGVNPMAVATGMELLGRWIRDARVRSGFGQAQLGRLTGIHQSTISRLENGRLEGLQLYRLAVLVYALEESLEALPIRRF
jgi:DNA-binding XRE family transcriptional regulator